MPKEDHLTEKLDSAKGKLNNADNIHTAPRIHGAKPLENSIPGLVAGFSTAYPPVADNQLHPSVQQTLAQSLGAPAHKAVWLAQHHSAKILDCANHGVSDTHRAYPPDGRTPREMPAMEAAAAFPPPLGGYDAQGRSTLPYDGATGDTKNPALLMVKTADCVPLLAVDPETGRYAALHAGWRGTALGILHNLLQGWKENGSSLGKVKLVLGPHIGPCCYEVQEDCLSQFTPADRKRGTENHSTHLDLAAVLRFQAESHGLPADALLAQAPCTKCHQHADGGFPFASHRRATSATSNGAGMDVGMGGGKTGGKAGRNVSFIGFLNGP